MSSLNIKLNNGTHIPWVGFGTGTALYNKDAAELVRLAIDSGFVHLDGAQIYENEETLGAGIKASGKDRSELYIVTKLRPGQPVDTVKESLKISLNKLGVDYVDLFLIHSPRPYNREGTLKEVWKLMEELQDEGLTKTIGVSNFRIQDLKVVLDGARIIPAVNQIELHPYLWSFAEPLLKFSQEHGIVTASYGGLTPLVPHRSAAGPLDEILPIIATRLSEANNKAGSVTVGQVLTKWLLAKGAIVVTTTSKRSRMDEFFAVPTLPDLTAEEIRTIDEAGTQMFKRYFMRPVFEED